MNTEDKSNPKNWTAEERDRVVSVFKWLLSEDKKQNPDRYKKVPEKPAEDGGIRK